MKKLFLTILTVVLVLGFVACQEPTHKVYTVTFDSQGGSSVNPVQVVEGNTVSKPSPDPDRTGYTFCGWYTTSDCTGTSYDFSNKVISDFTLYAKWTDAKSAKKWCVMSYFDFSNLTSSALYNLDEVCQSTPNENVKAYFLTGGSKYNYSIGSYPYLSAAIQAYNPSDPFGSSAEADTYQLWEYTSDGKFVEITFATKGMNDPDVLSQFIEQCVQMAKSSDPDADYNYVLELWNHGGGSYTGLIMDSAIPYTPQSVKQGKTIMSLADCGNTIKNVTIKNGFKFEAVVFDMCLMQSIETAHTITYDAAKYIIGSQTSSAACGSAYTDWFNFLYSNPDSTGYEFGKVFCDTAYAKLVELGSKDFINNVTWSVIDMSKFAAVETAYEAYSSADLSKVSVSAVENCIRNIERTAAYSSGFWDNYMYDINVFTNYIGSSATRSALLSAIDNAVVYKKYGETQEDAGCCGLSMCILTDTNGWNTECNFSTERNTEYLENCLTPNYRTFQKRITTGL